MTKIICERGQVILQYFVILAAVGVLMLFGGAFLTGTRASLETGMDDALGRVTGVPGVDTGGDAGSGTPDPGAPVDGGGDPEDGRRDAPILLELDT